MSGDQAHLYQLTAEAGFFLHAVVEQKGIDVAVTLFDPTGVKALEVDSPNGTEGLEPIFFLTKLSGTYRLEVRSLAKDAAGKYEIEVKELRPAVAQDSIFINAHQLFAGGLNDYRAVGTLESRKAGIVKFAEVIPLWQQLGNTAKEAASVNYLGEIYYSLAEFPKALSYFNQSLLLSQTANDRVLEGNILNNIALTYYTTGETQKSLEYYLPALTLLRATGDRGSEAVTLSNIGLVYDRLGEKQQALDYFSQALPLRREAKDPFGEAYTLASLGSLYSSLGETDKALDYFEKSLQIRRAVKDLRGEGVTLNNIGLVYDALDDLPKALDYYNQALLIHKKTGAIGSEAATLKNLGGVYTRSGDTPKALENLHQSLAICQKIGERRGEAVVFNNLGKLYNKLADAPTALNYFTQALAIVRSIGEKTAEIEIEYNIAQLQGKLGNLQQAVAGIQRAIRLVESLRTKVEMQQLRAAYFAALIKPYELYTDLLMRLHRQDPTKNYLAAAMQVNDQAKARTLLESLSEANADIRQGIDATLLKQERELKTQLNSKAYQVTRLLSSKASEEKKELGRTELETISNQLQEMEAKIRQTNPKYAALTQPQALSVADLQQQVLDADALLLEYALGDERSYLFAITKDSIKAFDLPKRAEIETLAKQFYEHLTARNKTVKFETLAERQQRLAQADAELPSTAAALSQMILAPVAAELKNQRLLVVNDGALQYIPFAALPLPEKTHVKASLLGVSNEIVYLPSASTLAVVRREIYHRQPAPKTIAVFADPIFDKNDERLTAAKAHKKRAAQVLAQARNRANRRSDSAAPNAAASQSQTNTTTASKSQPNTTTAKPETRSASTTSTASEKMPKPESEKTSIRESEKMPKPESEKTSTRESESPPKRESDVTRAAREVGLESDGMALPRMPFTRLEAQAILRLVPASQHKVAIDFEANKTTALSQELEQYRYVHFATHGFLNTAHPELSGIVLSLIDSEGNEADGFLRAHEIYNLKLPAELVVLSGCRTGLGKEIRGEGLMGLTRGFMYAGAARVLVSLWDVDDEATAALMSRFYQAMLGKEKFSPAAALRAAQASMAKNRRWSSPYYWAAFVLQGEPK
ncbi:MAG: CHAT domain-containing protein [Acidobacteria bacterium]|nr:CHAT domain-containing protein [Acidobacteriota bacterium]